MTKVSAASRAQLEAKALTETAETDVGGRPSVLTPETRKRIVECLKNGLDYKRAAAICRIGERTLRELRANDSEFAAECEEARASVDSDLIKTAIGIANGSALFVKSGDKVAMLKFLLEKRVYGNRSDVNVNVRDVTKMSEAELRAELRELVPELLEGDDDGND